MKIRKSKRFITNIKEIDYSNAFNECKGKNTKKRKAYRMKGEKQLLFQHNIPTK